MSKKRKTPAKRATPVSKKTKATIGKKIKPVPIAPKKAITVSASKYDQRDRPKLGGKDSVLNTIKASLRDSSKREKAIQKERAAKKGAKQKKAGAARGKAGKLLGKALGITNPNKNKQQSKNVAKGKAASGKKPVRYRKPAERKKKYKYVNPYLQELAVYKKKKLKKRDVTELERIKKNLQNAKYRTIQKLKKAVKPKRKADKLNKTDTNKLYKKEIHLSVAIKKISGKLGVGKQPAKVGKKKRSTKRQTITVKVKRKGKKTKEKTVEVIIKKEVVPIWEGRAVLTDLLKETLFKQYILNGKTYTRQQQPEIFMAFSQIEIRVRAVGVSTPHIIFYQRITDKICEISEYHY